MSRYPVHPLLFAAFPLAFLVSHNRDKTSGAEAIVPLGVSLACVAVVLVVGRVLFGNWRKAGIVASVLAVLFFSYGHVWTLLEGDRVAGVVVGRDLALAPLWLAIALGATVAVLRSRRQLLDTTRVLNIVATVLFVITVAPLVAGAFEGRPTITAASGADLRPDGRPRDIYYLIFDRYADEETLRTHLGFDNSPFVDGLERKGFVVTPESRANYQNTHMSLASSLNMRHLHYLSATVKRPTRNAKPIFEAIGRSAVATQLKEVGYRYIHVGSWAEFTASSPIADVNLEPIETSEFMRAIYGSTAISILSRHVSEAAPPDDSTTQRDATRGALRALDRARRLPGPKFVFAHIVPPHPPYVFDRHGNASRETKRDGNVDGYLEQVRFVNAQIERLVGRLLAGPVDEHPIVIIQADEGPYPRLSTRFPKTWADEPPGDLRVKFGILNAYYLPGESQAVYPSISPVNTFRVVFNRYFGTDMPMVPDEIYVLRDREDLYTYVPIGDRVASDPPPRPGSGKIVP